MRRHSPKSCPGLEEEPMHEEQYCLNNAREEYELRGPRCGMAVPISALGRKISGHGNWWKPRLFLRVVAKGRCRNRQRTGPRNGVWPARPARLPAGSQLQFVAVC